ncbi:hypothetical protein DPMN_101056 [Dreissena polymorpha]|uniref:Uncharacterized protein n=1 Tax=Dreissena polymorpha TaxID=45954 RepID=A0A9D4R8S0_DREPO|nr:hypothetical protein DPMN_101056 [Dreissena polymorpha]
MDVMPYATSVDPDQPAHSRSLVGSYPVHSYVKQGFAQSYLQTKLLTRLDWSYADHI